MPVSDVSRSPETWVLCIYDLTPRARFDHAVRTRLDEVFDYGRFQGHVDASARLLPQVADHQDLPPGALDAAGDQLAGFRIGEVTALLLVTPRGDPLLVLEVELPGEPDAAEVAGFLAATCFERELLTVSGQPLLAWLGDRLGLAAPLQFGRNVHQCVFPGGHLREELLRADAAPGPGDQLPPAVTTIVYRATVSADRGSQLGVRTPRALNNPGETLVAHGRGVSLIAGWSEQVENVLALAATTIVAAMGVLHRTRDLAFDALELNQSTQLVSTGDARELVSRLSSRLNELQLDLSFGVEAYVDSVLIPELVVEGFQSSMRMAADLDTGLTNTSRMVDRLAAVIRARAAVLDAATQDEHERRNRVFNVVLAVGSLIALPPSLLLAFFGVTSPDVDQARSVLDLDRYWFAYGLAWLPFAGLLLAGFLLRRRIRRDSRLVQADGQVGDPTVDPAGEQAVDPAGGLVVPAPRTAAALGRQPSATRREVP
ncbi:MAG: hypothetical protein GEV12_03695 [Micromonosporaceae bacterium]|nr:hypothetical protein [Micromonosporaceae bacterium]